MGKYYDSFMKLKMAKIFCDCCDSYRLDRQHAEIRHTVYEISYQNLALKCVTDVEPFDEIISFVKECTALNCDTARKTLNKLIMSGKLVASIEQGVEKAIEDAHRKS